MAIGGGTFTTRNKGLPGAYLNFVSASRADAALSDRGSAAMALELDWGVDGELFTVTAEEFWQNAPVLFGYDLSHDSMRGLCDLFSNIKVGHFYRLNGGEKASCDYATARYSGSRGNDLAVTVQESDTGVFTVTTLLDGEAVDRQTVSGAGALVDNDYLVFQKEGSLTATAGVSLSGGSNGTAEAADYEAFLQKVERESFHTLGCLSDDEAVKQLFVAFTRRMRNDVGAKFQTVLYRCEADDEGVISVYNKVTDGAETDLVYWVTGLQAGCSVEKSCLNVAYDGAFAVAADDTQSALEEALARGHFVLHRVGDTLRVLADQNSFVSHTAQKGGDFSDNQVIRVLDQIGNDIALLFATRYLGQVPNDPAGRISLWNDVVRHHQQLAEIRAIEDFSPENITVEAGDTKKSVVISDRITPVSAMAQLYMTIVVQ